jgi:glycosyltransferase involved in cell wall biosynthesis
METPLISVIIAVYNGDRFLKQAIESVLSQSYSNVEIIVLDDGSTDLSAQIAKSYSQVVYQYQTNAGVASARNAALKIAKGDYISFLDSDDFYHPDKLKKQLNHLGSNSSIDCSMVYVDNFLEEGHEITPELEDYFFNQEKLSFITFLTLRSIFDKVGDFNITYKRGSDCEWLTRARELELRLEPIPEALLKRRIHDTNLTVTGRKDDKQMRFRILKESMKRKREMAIGK